MTKTRKAGSGKLSNSPMSPPLDNDRPGIRVTSTWIQALYLSCSLWSHLQCARRSISKLTAHHDLGRVWLGTFKWKSYSCYMCSFNYEMFFLPRCLSHKPRIGCSISHLSGLALSSPILCVRRQTQVHTYAFFINLASFLNTWYK